VAQPYVGEIRMFGGNFAPVGWLFCEGQQLSISENETLFQLIGTTYGGDGETTFNLPNLTARIPVHFGNGPDGVTYPIAQAAGVTEVTLTVQQIPVHNHATRASGDPGLDLNPANAMLGLSPNVKLYREGQTPNAALAPQTITPTGGSQPHSNLMPYLCVNYIISLFGLFPSPT
jgi:microcystin-dependent protein